MTMSNIVVGIECLSDTRKTTLAKNICNSIYKKLSY